MFEHEYKNAMDHITPDTDVKEKILDKIELKEELKSRRNPALPWRIAFACVACIAIVFGIVVMPRDAFKTNLPADVGQPQLLSVGKSYDEIYELIKPKKLANYGNDDWLLYEESIEYIDMETATDGTTSSNDQAVPGAPSDIGQNGAIKDDNETAEEDKDFSNTTEQVEGVSEADIVKTDGKYIYYLFQDELIIFKAEGENSTFVSRTTLKENGYSDYGDMFLKNNRLILLQPDDYVDECNFVTIVIYDISDPANPQQVSTSRQEGYYNSSRMVGDYIYLISNYHINTASIDKDDPASFVPVTETNGKTAAVPADSIYLYEEETYEKQYTVIGAFNYKDGALSDTASLLGGADNIYCSQGNIILADSNYNSYDDSKEGSYSQNSTTVSRLEIKQGKIEYKTTGEVDGTLENQFFIDEHNGYFRFVTTVDMVEIQKRSFDNAEDMVIAYSFNNTSARLTVLDSNLKKTGEIKDLAKGERVYSVRFMGDIAYFVTFRQTDPLFSADLSDPANPKILGELKIPGFSEYMYPYGDGLLLGFGMDADEDTGRTTYLKISMFDISDPANVTEQNKTILDGYSYSSALNSSALNNHKAMLVSPDKNLIGFSTHDLIYYDDGNPNYKYMVYEYTGDGFICKAELTIPWNADKKVELDSIRGMFIGDNFYVVSPQSLQVFDINTFLQVTQINF